MKLLKKNKTDEKSWYDIKLHQLQEIHTLPKYDDKLDLMVNVLAILLDKDPADIEDMAVTDIMEEYSKWEFLKEPPQEKSIPIIKTEKGRLGLIDLGKLTLGQYVDIEEYLSEGSVFDNIHKVLAVIYLPVKKYNPITKKYTLEEYTIDENREKLFLDMGMDILYPMILFFYRIVKEFSIDFQRSLLEMKKEEVKKMIYQGEGLSETQRQELKKKLEESGI